MKRKIFTFLLSTGVAFALSMGTVGCMITGFDLALQKESTVIAACLISAMLCSGLLQLPHGGKVLAGLAVLGAGILWFQGTAQKQFLSLVGDVTHMYHLAYSWGWLDVGSRGAAADLPMAVIGIAISLCACRTVCRGKDTWLTVLLAALILGVCMVVTNTVPREQFLFCLLAPLILLILTAAVRQEDNAQSNRLTAMAAVPVVLALALLFLAVPQEGYVNQSAELREQLLHYIDYFPQIMEDKLAQVATEIQSNESKDVNLRNLGPRPRYTHTVMEVTADTGGLLYLRGQDYDTYNGTGWIASPHRAESLTCEGEGLGNVTVSTRSGKDMLFVPYYPDETVLLAGGMVHNKENLRTYSFARTGLPRDWDQETQSDSQVSIEFTDEIPTASDLERLAFGSTAERLRYLTLPGETKVEAQKILAAFFDRYQSRPEQARAIADFVRSSAAYDLDAQRMPSNKEDFALWFLQDAEKGYCVHFATAAVVLLRAADIPARYVTGYMVDAKAGETTKVTAGNAHAWAEYFLPSLGTWVVLDPTPVDLTEEETTAETEESAAVSTQPPAQTLPAETEAETETTLPEETTLPTEMQTPNPSEATEAGSGGLWLLLAVPVLLIPAQRQLRLYLKTRRRSRGTPNEQALARWREAVLAAQLLKEDVPAELFDLAQKAKFSQHTLQRDELLVFDGYLNAARRRLRKHPLYLQLLYRWFWVVY